MSQEAHEEVLEVIAHLQDYDGDYENAEKLGRALRAIEESRDKVAVRLGIALSLLPASLEPKYKQRVAALEEALRGRAG